MSQKLRFTPHHTQRGSHMSDDIQRQTTYTTDQERGMEVLGDERIKIQSLDNHAANANVTHSAQRNADAHTEAIRQLTTQTIQNAITHTNLAMANATENANLASKQALAALGANVGNITRHSDVTATRGEREESLATDRQWNIDEQAHVVDKILKSDTFRDGLRAAVATAIAATVTKD